MSRAKTSHWDSRAYFDQIVALHKDNKFLLHTPTANEQLISTFGMLQPSNYEAAKLVIVLVTKPYKSVHWPGGRKAR